MLPNDEANAPRFLYGPRRSGTVVGVSRHLIIKEGPRRVVVQRLPYGPYNGLFVHLLPTIYVDRSRLDAGGCDARRGDSMFAGDPSCPLGNLYRSRDAARFALALWVAMNPGVVAPHRPLPEPRQGRWPRPAGVDRGG